jgi:hypothetical protein
VLKHADLGRLGARSSRPLGASDAIGIH